MSQDRVRSPYEIAFQTACSEIAILDHGQNDLLQRLAHVRAWRQQKLTKLTRLMHANAPITRLPNETLAFIFESVPQDAITISHVNRYWRQVALRLPSLWRNIHSGLCNDQIVDYLNRSQPLSLTITLDVNYEDLTDGNSSDGDFGDEHSDDELPDKFVTRLIKLIEHVSRWHSLHVNCKSDKAMFTILEILAGLSAPCLTNISLQTRRDDYDDSSPSWDTSIFSGGAPLLRTVHLRGITLANCHFPSVEIVELKLDIRQLMFSFIHPKVFTYMPNLRVLDIRGSFLWSEEDMKGDPVVLQNLERLTWGCLLIKPLLVSIVTPTLRYLCLTTSLQDDVYRELDDHNIEDFTNAITGSHHIPILPNLEELRYDIELNYAADCIFVGLPRVSLVQFSPTDQQENCQLCNNFFKALVDSSSRWPHLTTIVFKSLPDQLFDGLRDLVLARSSEDHRFTIRIEYDPVMPYHYSPPRLSVEHMAWLKQHANVETVPRECN